MIAFGSLLATVSGLFASHKNTQTSPSQSSLNSNTEESSYQRSYSEPTKYYHCGSTVGCDWDSIDQAIDFEMLMESTRFYA